MDLLQADWFMSSAIFDNFRGDNAKEQKTKFMCSDIGKLIVNFLWSFDLPANLSFNFHGVLG